jgi:hypothetical protein
MFQTEYEFALPKGYVDEEGNIHKEGMMRLATASARVLSGDKWRCEDKGKMPEV